MLNPLLDQKYGLFSLFFHIRYSINFLIQFSYSIDEHNCLEGPNRLITPFIACGDLSGYDADMTYPLEVNKTFMIYFQKLNDFFIERFF